MEHNSSSHYSLSITNHSGEKQLVAVFQDYEGAKGNPVVWYSKEIGNGNTSTFEWNITWQLTWGTTDAVLAPGVTFTSAGDPVRVDPIHNQTNAATIGYDGDFNITTQKNPELQDGQLGITTTKEFTTDQAKHMQIGVCMNGQPAFVMHGKPNGKYIITTNPTYYVAVTDYKAGTVISATYISDPVKFDFPGEIRKRTGVLDNTMTIKFD